MPRLIPLLVLALTLLAPSVHAQQSNNNRNNAAAAAARAASQRSAAQRSRQRPQISKYRPTKPPTKPPVGMKPVPVTRLGVNKAPATRKPIVWKPQRMTNAQLKNGVLATQSKGQSVRLANGYKSAAHVHRDHIAQTKAQLTAQLQKKPVATSFHSLKVAEAAVRSVLNSSAPRINAWATSAKAGDKRSYTFKGTTNVGMGIRRGDKNVTSKLTKTRVVVRSLGDGKFFILSAFPVLD